ncbi:uncharacterized protein LOC126728582 [Quercus robur]|uniref:uncharacterized protein LOC126728582 n=1 Tax=Quercus robur TaxID=38942 RepID=UPI002163FCE5|nr:uncharacterized protein LOC126728582 [Quercus robur]
MSAICWNCRGLGNPRTVGTLQKLVLEEDPTLVFLMETKFNVEEMVEIKRKLERSQGLVVPSVRRSGGLALLWKESLLVDVQTFSPRHIDVIVTEDAGKMKWRFTGFYGNPETHKREESWSLLVSLSTRCDLPWVCMGDFNEICHRGEKTGGGERPEWQMSAFRSAINRSKLRDMGCVGPEFTWSRRLRARGWVRERLDRALVSTNWAGLFPGVRLYNRATCSSDHNILILKTLPPKSRSKRQRLFRFEAMWIKKDDCAEVVKEAWERGQMLGLQNQFRLCMDECRSALQSWNKTNFGHVGRKIASLSKKLQWLECLPGGVANMEEINETKGELIRMLSAEEVMWK